MSTADNATGKLEKATILNLETGDTITVLINPGEYSMQRGNSFAQTAIPGLSAPILQFVAGEMQTLDMELFIDTYVDHAAGDDAREVAAQVISLMDIDPDTHAPPRLEFAWGSLTFTCVLASAASTFVMFRGDGVPVRIRVTVTFNEYRNLELEAKSIKRQTSDYTSEHVVRDGDTVWSLATTFYDDPRKWRAIAIENQIDDPGAPLRVGRALRLPSLPYRDPSTDRILT